MKILKPQRHANPCKRSYCCAVHERNGHFALDRAAGIRIGQLVRRNRTDRNGQSLRTGIAANAGNDGHQHGECYHVFDGGTEEANHARCNQGGPQIRDQPPHARFVAVGYRLVDIAIASAGQAENIFVRFFLNDVDDIIGGDNTDQSARSIDNSG